MNPNSTGATASGDAVPALQTALAAEHVLVWAYGLATAFSKDSVASSVRAAAVHHRARRDQCQVVLRGAGVDPVPPQPGYRTPVAVSDQGSAMKLLAVAEGDACSAWRALLERTDDSALRSMGLDALTYSAVQATHWRQLTDQVPSAESLPGA